MPKLDGDAILENIAVQNREPFRLELARLLECAPDEKSLALFAKKSPDRWVNAVRSLAHLAGYSDNSVPTGDTNIYMQINQLPDSQLLEALQDTLKQIDQVKVLDHAEIEPIPDNSGPEIS